MKLDITGSALLKKQSLSVLLASSFLLGGAISLQPHSANAQQQIKPSVLEEIRQAPFSQLFKIQSGAATAYAVKDKDYKSKQGSVGVFTLWGEIPEQQRLETYVLYCLPNDKIASSDTHLVEVVLLDDNKELVKIDQILGVTSSQVHEIQPAQYIPTTFFADPFYVPFWNPFGPSISYVAPSYIPAVQCSAGGTRFDLNPIKEQIARLPNKTLAMKLIFKNGMTSTWRLGEGTIKATKELPSLRKVAGV